MATNQNIPLHKQPRYTGFEVLTHGCFTLDNEIRMTAYVRERRSRKLDDCKHLVVYRSESLGTCHDVACRIHKAQRSHENRLKKILASAALADQYK